MPVINRSVTVPYSVTKMYDLVNTIEDYPKFLPWCRSSEIHHRNEDEVKATLTLGHGAIQKSFTTCNLLQAGKMIEMRLVSGPFKQLLGFWRFTELANDGCQIDFDLEFEFSNKLMAMAFGAVFQQVAHTLVDAFCKRADELYGIKKVS